MKIFIDILKDIITDSYLASRYDQEGLDDRVFETTILFFYKTRLYTTKNITEIESLYNNLRLSKFVDQRKDIEDHSFPLLWLTELSQKLLIQAKNYEQYQDLSYEQIIQLIAEDLATVYNLHVTTQSLVVDPVYQLTLGKQKWVELFCNNPWLIIAALIRYLPVDIFEPMLQSHQEGEEE